MARFDVYVTYKKGIFDPPGATAERALQHLGYDEVRSVRIGKYVQLEVADGTSEDRVREMCEKLLANPVIEDFRIVRVEEA
ncbi:phosphoribosylformylglycinamidine synthase subunit PurS [Coriobacteriia bacterium Es71-Z0120]|uniref:phosphoribosylformylglycinamidine synthase subunit PurS n=1 Tax=Parvivirga hydrogeniphila TaxID=2939460 RepID=UPI0022608EF2|nr:phosphoribosylformylglycinamidine synthase subunit PurS [Parvivirga hydrogeniphila]MCL4078037.1 phosphoribosylformylglycinamidine synthase subunit PurS [Parvivirga hydrogeniphila]